MRRRLIAIALLLVVGTSGLLAGCRESEPEPPYNYDLGDGATRLLPAASVFAGARDESISKGNVRAELVRRGDEATPGEVATTVQPVTAADLPPASSVGEAFGSVGRALLGNLMAGGGGGAQPAGEPAPTESAATDTGALGAEDAEAIQALFGAYRDAWAGRQFGQIRPLCAARQQTFAQQFYDLKDELNASLNALIDAAERATPGAKAAADEQLTAATGAMALETLASFGADGASGVLSRAGAAPIPVTFAREDGGWRILDPFVPDEGAWPARRDALQARIDRLDDMTASADGGALDEAQVRDAIAAAIAALFEQPEP